MQIIGIICEYSPFHNGHIYHIEEIKKKYPSSLIILCLNGYFLERGQISLLSKEDKTKIALINKVDIVIELPTLFGTQSADTFANISVSLLHHLGVKKIIFGSETEDTLKLHHLASFQLEENFRLKKSPLSYPKRLNEALKEEEKIGPNDILAISYIKAILKNNYDMTYETILRTNDFHDIKAKEKIISASNIRHKLEKKEDVSFYMPKESLEALNKINESLLFEFLRFKILTENNLNAYLDVTEGLDNKLKKEILKVHTIKELLEHLKSKRYTYNRLNRMLIHILLGITKEDVKTPLTYVKILGFNNRGQDYLKNNKPSLRTSIDYSSRAYEIEKRASYLYQILSSKKTMLFDNLNQPIIVKDKESNQK